MIVPFPEAYRPFEEVIVFGHKRKRPMVDQGEETRWKSWKSVQAPSGYRYQIPPGNGPRVFQKVEPTEPELRQMVTNSPLHSYLTLAPVAPLPSPPLPLGIGHVALLLASGHLNGVVRPGDRPPHVVRGTARKRALVSDVTDTENPDGSTTTRTTISEHIELVIRTVDHTGHIHTYSEADAKEE